MCGKDSIITIMKLGRRKAYLDLEVRRRCCEAGVGDLVIVQGKRKAEQSCGGCWQGKGRAKSCFKDKIDQMWQEQSIG